MIIFILGNDKKISPQTRPRIHTKFNTTKNFSIVSASLPCYQSPSLMISKNPGEPEGLPWIRIKSRQMIISSGTL